MRRAAGAGPGGGVRVTRGAYAVAICRAAACHVAGKPGRILPITLDTMQI